MKILRISLLNIASLGGEHTIDFTRAPLVNTGLFSISGPTGSGKSTLLDALCLALFAATPRMEVAKGTRAVEDAGLELQQNDVRNLLRRGCGTGFAETAFVGVDGETYTARWTVRRARESAGGRLQATEHILLKGNVQPGSQGVAAAGGTATAVKKEIVARLGMSFDQFRRAVLLAQGDFATFLKAPDPERAEILQALTGTGRFENISKAVFQRNKREQELVRELTTQIGAAPPLSPEARAAAEEELGKAQGLQQQIERRLAGRQKQLEWFEAQTGHQQNLAAASKEVARLEAEVQENAPRKRTLEWIQTASLEAGPKRLAEKQAHTNLAEALNRAAHLRQLDGTLAAALEAAEAQQKSAEKSLTGVLERQKVIDAELAKARVLDGELAQLEKAASLAQREHASALQALQNAESALSKLNADLGALTQQKQALQQRTARVAAFAPFAKDLEVWLERFKTEEKARLKKQQLEKRIQSAEKDSAEAARLLEQLSSALPELREKRDRSEAALKEAVEKAAAFNPEDVLTGRRNGLALQSALQKARTHLADETRLQGERQRCLTSRDTLEQQIGTENLRRLELAETLVPECLSTLKQAQESFRLAEAAVSEQAAILREKLVPGEACPVCGSREHPNAGAEVSEHNAVLSVLKRDAGEKEKVLQKLQGELAAVEARIGEKNGQLQDAIRQLAHLDDQLTVAARYTPELKEVADLLQKPAPQRDEGLTRLEAETADQLRLLDRTDANRIEADKQQKILRAVFERAERELNTAEKAEADARNADASARREQANTLSELKTGRTEHDAALEAISPVVLAFAGQDKGAQKSGTSTPEQNYATDPEDFRKRFVAGAKEHNDAAQLLGSVEQEDATKRPQLGTLGNAESDARVALATRTSDLAAANATLLEKKALRTALLGGRTVETAEKEASAEVQSARTLESHSGKAFIEARDNLSTHRGLLEDQQKRVTALEKTVEAERAAVNDWISSFVTREGRELDRTQLDDWLGRDAQWLTREKNTLDTAAHALASARGMEGGMRRQLEDHLRAKTTEDEHETVKTEVAHLSVEAATAGEAVNLKRAVVLNDDDRILKVGELARHLEAQAKQAGPWEKLNDLIGSSDGSRFRGIAQQWTLEILLSHANAQLARLSGRYRLERLRDSLNLLVTDLEMDGQQRSVHSLSGGESFLVSLGLALGLASLTSSRLLIESLFIDEGFGSLDSETLRVALNALNHLEAQGRKVGVISHVSEMVDAIPVQVRVVRGQGGASKIVV